jgi:DNA-binding MltR family transcriptional regulator
MRTNDQARDQDRLFQKTLVGETDRGVSLVSAAYLGEELRLLLSKMFVDSPKIVSALFDSAGPLATLSSRIDLAFVTGLLSNESHRLLHLVRKIRNDFAHQHRDMSFADEAITVRCRELKTLIKNYGEKRSRVLYIRAVMYLLAEIHARAKKVQRAKVLSFKPVGRDFDSLRLESAIEALTSTFTYEETLRFISPNTSEEEKKRLFVEAFRRSGSAGVQLVPRRKRKSKADARIEAEISRFKSEREAQVSWLTEELRLLGPQAAEGLTVASIAEMLRHVSPKTENDPTNE